MSNLTPEELENQMMDILRKDAEAEVTKIATLQGANVAMLSLLIRKGVLEKEDIKYYETTAEAATLELKKVLKGKSPSIHEDADNINIEIILKQEISFLEGTIGIAKLLYYDENSLSALRRTEVSLKKKLKEIQNKVEDETELNPGN
ncbi:MAG: hypothetical protein ACFFFC_00425 [Candidatus Thorarchaeota archaeon]